MMMMIMRWRSKYNAKQKKTMSDTTKQQQTSLSWDWGTIVHRDVFGMVQI